MSLRHAALGLLADQPGSGYDLLKRFQTAMANVWSATQSQLYGELAKLEKAGLIKVTSSGPRGRKEYEITPEGREELRSWLLSPLSAPPRSEMLLRVYFLGALKPEQARAYLSAIDDSAGQRLARLTALESAIDWDDSDPSLYGHLALEYGKRLSAMQSEWASWAAARVKAARA
ncbi:MAG TPA: PadR family transcriptional regulator [Amycolatopsis sp.]|jgi:PadR family transcriptional regulator AphA|nr:PadR family transcriptional regulator [Amycolatopsis sp.]